MRDSLVRQGADRLDSPLAVLDGEGTVVYANDAWDQFDVAGTVPEAAAAGEAYLPACDAIADETVAATARTEFEALLAGETERVQLAYDCPREAALPRRFRLQGTRFTADDGAHVVVEHPERTDEHRTAQDREHYRAVLADVATAISHDIRSPITAALSWAELLATDPDTDTDKTDRVVSALHRTNAIADSAVTLARETAVDEVDGVDAGRVARAAWERVDSTAADLVVADTEPVLADERTLELLLEQLLRNAVQHGTRADGGVDPADLTVRVGPLDDGFYVADDGAGIEDGLRDTLFEPGVTTGSGDDHTGLGLTIVERSAEAHGWTVTATEPDGGGARFEITGVRRL
jgi:signal transduction histidine kinase